MTGALLFFFFAVGDLPRNEVSDYMITKATEDEVLPKHFKEKETLTIRDEEDPE